MQTAAIFQLLKIMMMAGEVREMNFFYYSSEWISRGEKAEDEEGEMFIALCRKVFSPISMAKILNRSERSSLRKACNFSFL